MGLGSQPGSIQSQPGFFAPGQLGGAAVGALATPGYHTVIVTALAHYHRVTVVAASG